MSETCREKLKKAPKLKEEMKKPRNTVVYLSHNGKNSSSDEELASNNDGRDKVNVIPDEDVSGDCFLAANRGADEQSPRIGK